MNGRARRPAPSWCEAALHNATSQAARWRTARGHSRGPRAPRPGAGSAESILGPASATVRSPGTRSRASGSASMTAEASGARLRSRRRDQAQRRVSVAELGAQGGAIRHRPPDRIRARSRRSGSYARSTRGCSATLGRRWPARHPPHRQRRSHGHGCPGAVRHARSSRRCSPRSGPPHGGGRPALAGSRRSRSARRTARSSARGSRWRKWSISQPSSAIQTSNRSSRTRSSKTMKFAQKISSIRRRA